MREPKLTNSDGDGKGEESFRYTSGRWLYDESEQLSKRYRIFDIPALCSAVARTCGSRCANITKLPEGFHNRTFLLRLENGMEVIARLPNPNAGCPRLTTLSEVATLDFVSRFHLSRRCRLSRNYANVCDSRTQLRKVLKLPVPLVYSWNAEASLASNPVGAEYILMEKVPGRPLGSVWNGMGDAKRYDLVKQITGIEAKLAQARLSRFGSLYHRESLDEIRRIPGQSTILIDKTRYASTEKFCIGPTTDRSFWEGGRGKLELDRGPWASALEYFSAVVKREMAWIKGHTGSGREVSSNAGSERTSPMTHLALLEQFLRILPFVLPKDQNITCPTLWHTDLHHDNVFVDDAEPPHITGIIDWQEIWAAPFFLQARFASAFDCDWPYPWGAVMPTLPPNYNDLSEAEKSEAQAVLREVKLKKFYEVASRKFNPLLFRALDAIRGDQEEQIFAIFDLVGRSWKDGPIPLRSLLIQIVSRWDSLVGDGGVPCPISFSSEEMARSQAEAEAWAESYRAFYDLKSSVVGREGWVPHEDYAEAMERYVAHREELDLLRRKFEEFGGRDG